MASAQDILIRIRGKDDTGSAFKNVESKAGRLKNTLTNAASMTAGMIGYDLFNSILESANASINASQHLDYFAGRLNMSASDVQKFRGEIDKLQKEYRKIDMTAVGASAEEMAVKFNLPKDSLGDLTKMTAVMSSAFVKEGRTQEDAILAVNDAMDGQFKRLQELGITEEDLKKNGWSGDLNDKAGLISAINKSLAEGGYDQTAKDITSLDDAWQVLSVTVGQFLASVIVPLTPLIVGVVDAISGLLEFIQNNGWAQGVLLIGGLTLGFILLAGSMVTAEGAFIGFQALMPAFITELSAVASQFMLITVAGAPLWAIVAAVAAIAIAVYEVGIYFGWWKDVGTMLQAIGDGVRRLWEAFINSPQVQGAIKAVQGALQALWNYAQPAIQWLQAAWTNLFGSSGSNPDIVHGIIVAFQRLGEIAGQVFGILQRGFNTVAYIVTPLWNGLSQLIGVFGQLMNGSISWQDAFMKVLTIIGTAVRGFSARLAPIALQIGRTLLNGIVNTLRRIPVLLGQLLLQAVTRIGTFGNNAAIRARAAGRQILMGIVNYIRQLPGRVGSFMMQLPGRISGAAGAAVGAAMSLASQLLTAVVNGVKGIADAVFNEFMNIGNKIRDAIGNAVNNALQFGNDIKDAVLGALGIHSPGIIQRKIAIEFQDIPGRITESNGQVYTAAQSYASRIMNGFNTPPMNHANLNAYRLGANYNPTNQGNGNNTTIIIGEGAIQLDARNLTTKESKQVLINALQGLDSIKNIEVQGA